MSLGRWISDNVGVAFLTIALSIIEALCYAETCHKLYKWRCPDLGIVSAIMFYGIVPPFGAYAQAVIKDSLFFAVFTLYIALFTDICLCRLKMKARICKSKIFFFTLISVAVCHLCRNNGFYMVIPANIALIFTLVKYRKKYMIVSVILVLVAWIGYNNVFLPLSHVEPGSKREMLSIPFQQTARYIKYCPEDITTEEKEDIEKVLDFDYIGENYTPEVSDAVKNTYNEDATQEDLKNYFHTWFRMFLKHPTVYIQAFLANMYGYIYPFSNHNIVSTYQFYIKYEPQDDPEKGLNIYYYFDEKVRDGIEGWAELWKTAPGLSQIINPGTTTWVLIILVGIILKNKKWRILPIMVAPLLNVAVCCASPVNGLLRYSWPLAACMPILIYVVSMEIVRKSRKNFNSNIF